MGTSSKITRVQLNVNQDFESVLLGIVSAEPDYKLCLALNRSLKISLKNASPVAVRDNTEETTFSRFSDASSSPGLIYELISNRSGRNFFLKKLKNIDYFFHVSDLDKIINNDEIAAILRDTEHITAVFNLDPEKIKDKNLQYLIH